MKKIFQKSGSLIMALLVLFSTMSFTVDKHFCGSMLVDQAVFSEAQSCGMEHSGDMTGENGCKDQKVSVEGQKDLKMSFFDLDLQQQVFVASFTYSYIDLFEGLPQQEIPFSDYSPPLLVTDIQVLNETFLI
jgi:hypothetical protein